jgi:hypothetical protein
MKVKLVMSMYRNHVLYRKGTVMEIPDEPKVERVDPRTKEKILVPATFSMKAMQEIEGDNDEPVTPKKKAKPKKKSTKAADPEKDAAAVTDEPSGEDEL